MAKAELRCAKFKAWHADLDSALQALPPLSGCSSDVLKALALAPPRERKQILLVTERDTPIAVMPLIRQEAGLWRPVTYYIIPGMPFPVAEGRFIDALGAAKRTVEAVLWRCGEIDLAAADKVRRQATYRFDFSNDFEAYWRKTEMMRQIRKARERCQEFALAVNAPGAGEWVVRNCGVKWEMDPLGAAHRAIATRLLEAQGLLSTITASKDGAFIAGITVLRHGSDAIAHTMYREPGYEEQKVGVRIIDAAFQHAKAMGAACLDMGGGQAYKAKWAPPAGEKIEVQMYGPRVFYLANRAARAIVRVAKHKRIGRGPLGSAPGCSSQSKLAGA